MSNPLQTRTDRNAKYQQLALSKEWGFSAIVKFSCRPSCTKNLSSHLKTRLSCISKTTQEINYGLSDPTQQIKRCEAIQRQYREIADKIRQRDSENYNLQSEWGARTVEKLATNDANKRIRLTQQQSDIKRRQSSLIRELHLLRQELQDIRNDFNFQGCDAFVGSL